MIRITFLIYCTRYEPYDMVYMVRTMSHGPCEIDSMIWAISQSQQKRFNWSKCILTRLFLACFIFSLRFHSSNYKLYLTTNMFLLPKILLLSWCLIRCFPILIGPPSECWLIKSRDEMSILFSLFLIIKISTDSIGSIQFLEEGFCTFSLDSKAAWRRC